MGRLFTGATSLVIDRLAADDAGDLDDRPV